MKYVEALRNENKQCGNEHPKQRAQHVQNTGGCKGEHEPGEGVL